MSSKNAPKLPCKKGAISTQEKAFIKENTGILTVEEIAEKLNRNIDFVRKYTVKTMSSSGIFNTEDIEYEIKLKMETSEAWKAISKELSETELKRFVETYSKMVGENRDGFTATEEMQIMQAAKIDILMSRELQLRQVLEEQIIKLEAELKGFGHQETELSQDDIARKRQVETMLSSYRSGLAQSYTPYLKMQEQYNKLMDKLKMSRDQRVQKIDSVKVSWIDVLKEINDDQRREIIGIGLQTGHKEYAKEYNRLAASHTYTNQSVDQPLLSAETYNEETGSDLEKDTGDKTAD